MKAPEVQTLPVAEFMVRYAPKFYADTWANIEVEREDYANPEDPDGEFDDHFLAGGETGMDFDDLVASIAEDGIDHPVDIEGGVVGDGHHRVVAAMLTGQPVPFLVWS